MGGAGTQRFAKFVKHLPALGWRPSVVAAGSLGDVNAPHADRTLLADIPRDVRVERVEAKPLTAGQAVKKRLRFWLDGEDWVAAAMPTALEVARETKPDVVVVTGSPFAAYAIGERLKRELGVPWVLDLRDPWTLDGWRQWATMLHARWDRNHMRRAMRSAAATIANVPAAGAALAEAVPEAADKIVVIPNGYDAADFPADALPPNQDHLEIVHVGSLQSLDPVKKRLVGGKSWRWIDPSGRSARPIIEGLARLLRDRPQLREKVRLTFVGTVHDSNLRLADELGVRDRIDAVGYLSHDQSSQRLLSAGAVFVPLYDVAKGDEALIVPGKTYEAIASRRPVLACLPPGDADRLIRHLGIGPVVRPGDVGGMATALGQLIDAHPQRSVAAPPEAFERRSLTKLLAALLDRVADGRPPREGHVDPWRAIGVPDTP